ncbi:hypothetical protein BST61_g8895 [Cercospora zeina]
MSAPTAFSADSPAYQRREKRRQKVTRACDNCKSRKRRCTGELPCSTCHATGAHCTYRSRYTRGRLVAPQPANYTGSTSSTITSTPLHQQQPQAESAFEQARSEPPEHSLGTSNPSPVGPPEGSNASDGHYVGAISPHVFLRRTLQRLQDDEACVNSTPSPKGAAAFTSIFAHGDRPAPAVDHYGSTLPSYQTTSMLLQHYFDLAMPTIRFLHRGTVESWLDAFHDAESRDDGATQRSPAREAVVLVVIATARLLNVDRGEEILDADETSWREGLRAFKPALRLVCIFCRPPDQARLGSCLARRCY